MVRVIFTIDQYRTNTVPKETNLYISVWKGISSFCLLNIQKKNPSALWKGTGVDRV